MLMGMLLAEAMAYYGKSLGELVRELHREFGPHHYGRLDLQLRPEQKDRAVEEVSREDLGQFVGFGLLRREDMDGVKLYLDNGAWVLVRPSGNRASAARLCGSGITRGRPRGAVAHGKVCSRAVEAGGNLAEVRESSRKLFSEIREEEIRKWMQMHCPARRAELLLAS